MTEAEPGRPGAIGPLHRARLLQQLTAARERRAPLLHLFHPGFQRRGHRGGIELDAGDAGGLEDALIVFGGLLQALLQQESECLGDGRGRGPHVASRQRRPIVQEAALDPVVHPARLIGERVESADHIESVAERRATFGEQAHDAEITGSALELTLRPVRGAVYVGGASLAPADSQQ